MLSATLPNKYQKSIGMRSLRRFDTVSTFVSEELSHLGETDSSTTFSEKNGDQNRIVSTSNRRDFGRNGVEPALCPCSLFTLSPLTPLDPDPVREARWGGARLGLARSQVKRPASSASCLLPACLSR